MAAIAADLLERLAATSPRDWIVAASVASLVLTIAWIGHKVSELLESIDALRGRLARAEGNLTNAEDRVARADERLASAERSLETRVRNVELRQDRLQAKVEHVGQSWRDSGQPTANLKYTGPVTEFDLLGLKRGE